MTAFLAAHWVEIALSLITAGALGFCRGFWKKYQSYKKMIEEISNQKTEEVIETKLEPIVEDIEELRKYIWKTADDEKKHMNLIISSYRLYLVRMCKLYLEQGFLTQDQYDELSDFYNVYEQLGGNGQAKQYYDKTIAMPIK